MQVQDLLGVLGLTEQDARDDRTVTFDRVDYDSRRAGPGSLFCCVPGAVVDGHAFAAQAVRQGATALLVERWVEVAVTQVRVPAMRPAMAQAAAAVWGHPSRGLEVVGVTGTNGKTTTTFLLDAIFAAAGRPSAVLGTLTGPRTTPEAPDLQEWFARRRDEGVRSVAMEVSSHALALHRVDATRFAAAVFTNLSRDHLDYHDTMEAYFEAKARLFDPVFTDLAVVNLDDPHGRLLRDASTVPTIGYSLADVDDVVIGAARSRFVWRGQAISLALGGRFNISNALAAAETATALGIDPEIVAAGLTRELVIPGRFEVIDEGQPYRVIVDFAHTPDALEQVLLAAREIAAGHRVHVVFGCGGDRDGTKRPAMGAVAAQQADRVVLTADNSRHEDTRAIIGSVKDGYDRTEGAVASELRIEPDRDAAIALALAGATAGDVVVIAGKGHETTQTIGDTVTPFDDRVAARRHLRGDVA